MANPAAVVDTSILIEYLRKEQKSRSILFQFAADYDLFMPTLVAFELWAGTTNETRQQELQRLMALFTPLPLNSTIAEEAGKLYRHLKRHNQLLEIRDLLIAAHALQLQLPLLTLNYRHFERVPQLNLLPSRDCP